MDKLDETVLYSEAIDVATYGRQRDKLREKLTLAKIDSTKPFQGSDRLARIRKVFRNKIRQQVPVARFRRTFVQQPAPLRRSHRFAAQRVFSYQPRALEFLLDP